MNIYMTCIAKEWFIVVVTGFLFFECSDNLPKSMIDVEGGNDRIGNVVISDSMFAFDDVVGRTYTISLSQDLEPKKIVQIALKSENSALLVSSDVINFTNATGKDSQTITVARANGASETIMADIIGVISHTIALSADSDPNITTFQGDSIIRITVRSTAPVVDSDNDGLIEIKNTIMLSNMRYNLAGTSYKKLIMQTIGNSKGCPLNGCYGYELTDHIDINNNNRIDMQTKTIRGKRYMVIDTTIDRSWVPIGDNLTDNDESRFTVIFEGNNYTIANLWVNVALPSAGLFGVTGKKVTIRNVGIISGSIHLSSSSSGGLVGDSRGI